MPESFVRRFLQTLVLLMPFVGISGQTPREDIRKNIRCSASNYMAYPGPVQHRLTPPPSGKNPFYISHYGRHGSRHHIKNITYNIPYDILSAADSAGKLTPLGHDVLQRLIAIRSEADNRNGELTSLGARQHREIARRMMQRFPEVFADNAVVDAKSTTVLRCLLSMENALLEIKAVNPKLRIYHDASYHDMYYMNQQDKKLIAQKMDSATQARYDEYAQKREINSRLVSELFSDTAYARQNVDAGKLNYYLFKVASNVQSMDLRRKITLYDIFNTEEAYRNWQKENAWWYIAYGGSTINGGKQPFTQRNLLRRIIADADSCIALEYPCAQLRYGHETMVMPLVCLMDINGYGIATDDLESLEQRGWVNYKIFPMAANIQMVFYRRDPADTDVLFKILLNENEATLPLPSDMAPYYKWSDFRSYFLRKLDSYEE